MADSVFYDRVQFRVSSVGTLDFSGIASIPGFRTPSGAAPTGAAVPDGTIVSYTAESDDLLQWEVGQGTYTAGVLARTIVYESSTGAKVNFINPPTIRFDVLAADIVRASLEHEFANNPATTSGLSYGVFGGTLISQLGSFTAADDVFTLADNTTTYVEMNDFAIVHTSTTGFTAGFMPMQIVTTSGGRITTIVDKRGRFTVLPASGGGGGTVNLTAGAGITLTPSTIVGTGVIAQATTGVVAGSYNSANITVNAQGNITAASNGSGGGGSSLPSAATLAAEMVPTNLLGSWSSARGVVNAANSAFGDINAAPRATIQAAIDYCFANSIYTLYIPNNAGGGYNLDGPIFFDPPANLRSGISLANQKLGVTASPGVFGKGLHVFVEKETIFSTFDGTTWWQTAPAFWIGTQNNTRIFNLVVRGPNTPGTINNRQLDPRSTGFAIASGNGGATDTKLENCKATKFYRGISVGQNGPSSLAEANKFVDCYIQDHAIALDIINNQALVNEVERGAFLADIVTFNCRTGQDLVVHGGEHGGSQTSQTTTASVSSVTALSTFTDTLPGSQTFTNFRFTCIGGGSSALLDGRFYYNVALLNLPSFGYVPCAQTAHDSGTGISTLTLDQGWVWHHFASGGINLKTQTDFDNELLAVTTILLGQRSTIAVGRVTLEGDLHLEGNQSWALYIGDRTHNANGRLQVNNIDTNNWKPGDGGDANIKLFNRHHPWIKGAGGDIILNNWLVNPDGESNGPPVVIQFAEISDNQSYTQFIANECSWLANTNHRYVGKTDHGPPTQNGPYYDSTLTSRAMIGSNAFGFGTWTRSGWSRKDVNTLSDSQLIYRSGTGRTNFWGYRPARSETTRLTQSDVNSLLAGSGPLICGGSLCSIAQIGGQKATHCIDVGGDGYSLWSDQTINWSFKGGTHVITLSGGTITQFFNGMEIGLSHASINSGTAFYVIVNGCYYNDNSTSGYITVAAKSGTVLPGTITTTYTGTTILQRKSAMSFPGQVRSERVSTQFDSTNQTLTDVTGLSITLARGLSYRIRAVLFTTSSSSGGVKVALGTSGTLTATAIIYEGETSDNSAGVLLTSRATALASAVGAVTAVTVARIEITGEITVNAAGALTVQFARNAASGTSSVLVGSFLEVLEIV